MPRYRARVDNMQPILRADGTLDRDQLAAETDASRADRLEIQDEFHALEERIARLEQSPAFLSPVSTRAAIRVETSANGYPSSTGFNARVSSIVTINLTISFTEKIPLPYQVYLHDQEPGSRIFYWVDRVTPEFVRLRATTTTNTPVNWETSAHIFVMQVLKASKENI